MAGLIAEQVAALGLSQRQFADLVGASTKHVCQVFNGKATAQMDTLDKWVEALGYKFTVELED
jgi:transcriptional regulator with XRE-family HTH domain